MFLKKRLLIIGQVMMDTMGPELQVFNKSGNPIELKAGDSVTITPDSSDLPAGDILPVNYAELASVSPQ